MKSRMKFSRIFVAVVLCYVCMESGIVTAKDLFCRDPDTGKLYPANSTWPSTTFCGNYTCKLRKRPNSTNEIPVLRSINITEKDLLVKTLNNSVTMTSSANTGPLVSVTKGTSPPTMQPILHKQNVNKNVNTITINDIERVVKDSDRYLTEAEINKISETLHNIKKSDLQAIVDIYNLAQELYKEIEKSPSSIENDITSTTQKHLTSPKSITPTYAQDKGYFKAMPKYTEMNSDQRQKYWYDALTNHFAKNDRDMNNGESNYVGTLTAPIIEKRYPFFSGLFSPNDFGRLPYRHHGLNVNIQNTQPLPSKPIMNLPPPPKPCESPVNLNLLPKNSFTRYSGLLKKPFHVNIHRPTPPSLLLPYPYVLVNRNTSEVPKKTYVKSKQNNYIKEMMPAMSQIIHRVPKLLDNPKTKKEESLLPKFYSNKRKSDKLLPDWQTDSLSPSILEEVRANIEEKPTFFKAFPFRRHIDLERVGKVVRVDDNFRSKRHESNDEEYEVYIEKNTCADPMQPGFFRRGNDTQPFPHCCPQKIEVN